MIVNIYAPQGHEEFYVAGADHFPIPGRGDKMEIRFSEECRRCLSGRVKEIVYRYEVSKPHHDSGYMRCNITQDAEAVEVSIELE